MQRARCLSRQLAGELQRRRNHMTDVSVDFEVLRACMAVRGLFMDFYRRLAVEGYMWEPEVVAIGSQSRLDAVMEEEQVGFSMRLDLEWEQQDLPYMLCVDRSRARYDEDPMKSVGSGISLARRRTRSS